MNRKGFVPIIAIIIIAAVLVAGGAYWYFHRSMKGQVAQNSLTTSTIQEMIATSTELVQPTSTLQQEESIVSSSSVQVGKFTVVADCDASENAFKIEIFKNGSSTQIISPYTQLASGGGSCPAPQVRDINSDGFPDFSVVYNYGNKYADSIYWLYNSSTDQFGCPNVKPSGKPWMACNLAEPY